MTTVEDEVRAMMVAVRSWLAEHYPLHVYEIERERHRPLPDGMRLQMHPSVAHRVRQIPPPVGNFENFLDLDAWKKRFEVPVEVTPALPEGMWRLITVTEDVHCGGQVS